MLADDPVMAFSATVRPEAARAFYEGQLGLEFVGDEPYALVFRNGPTMLRVQKVEKVGDITYTVLGWHVTSIDATVAELAGKGVEFEHVGLPDQDERGIWNTPSGARVAWFRDPDGNILSLTELP